MTALPVVVIPQVKDATVITPPPAPPVDVIISPTTGESIVVTPVQKGQPGPPGPQGPPGPGWPLTVKATAPTAADYGGTEIPVNAIWVKTPIT